MANKECDCCGYETEVEQLRDPEIGRKVSLCSICSHTHIGNINRGAQIDNNQLAMAIAWIGNDILDAINSTKYREP